MKFAKNTRAIHVGNRARTPEPRSVGVLKKSVSQLSPTELWGCQTPFSNSQAGRVAGR